MHDTRENIYPVDRLRPRRAIRQRLLGARPQEADVVLRVFELLPSSIDEGQGKCPLLGETDW